MGTYVTVPSTHTVEIAIVNSGFGGMPRLGRGVWGASIPRERVRRLAAGRRSVRRRGVRGRVGGNYLAWLRAD